MKQQKTKPNIICLTWVAIPTGQVFRWHFLIIVQPMAMRGAVEKPNSSAPSKAPITTSRPVRICPSTCRITLLRRLFSIRVWWVSAMPSSHGKPACLIPDHVLAPVPPSWPEITMCSEWPYYKKRKDCSQLSLIWLFQYIIVLHTYHGMENNFWIQSDLQHLSWQNCSKTVA